MFIRVKTTQNSPRKSVQIVESRRVEGKVKQRIVKHIGVALDGEQLEELKALADTIKIQLELDAQLPLYTPEEIVKLEKYSKKPAKSNKDKQTLSTTNNQADTKTVMFDKSDYDVNLLDILEEDRVIKGIHDIYGKLYDELGFNKILANPARNVASNRALKEIVLARVANPDSKRGSVINLEENFGVSLDLNTVYNMMDKIDDKEILKLNKVVYDKTKALFKDKIDIVYFDATTLYFESFTEDALKKNGYSKDGKFNQPQVVLALLVTKSGLPIGYKAFSGDTFDGHTILPVLKEVQKHYDIDSVVFVADSGMFNRANLEEFDKIHNPLLFKCSQYKWSATKVKMTLKDYQHQYREFNKNSNITYIVGARVKSMTKDIKEQILNIDNYRVIDDNTKVKTINYQGKKLLVSYSIKRAAKDKHEREKGIQKLRDRLKKSSSVKSQLSNQGYKKYLQLEQTNQDNNQTLEPRLFYLYVPYENQDDLPDFDTGEFTFGFSQLFNTNRFAGADRQADANQLSVALTTRTFNGENGQELWRLSFGQIFYFESQRVQLENQPEVDENLSPFIAELAWQTINRLSTVTGLQYDWDENRIDVGSLGLRWSGKKGERIGFEYRFRRDRVDQFDFRIFWPINERWKVLSRINYSFADNDILEIQGGVEYESCCWAVRTVLRRYLKNRDGDYRDSIFFELNLKGLASVGTRTDDLFRN